MADNKKPQQKARIITDKEMNNALYLITNAGHRALMALLFGTGARISEVVRSISAADIHYDEKNNCLEIEITTEKRKHNPVRTVIVDYDFLIVPILSWLVIQKDEPYLFSMSRQRAHRLVQRYFNTKPHSFRHTHATHLGRMMNGFELCQQMGWARIDSAQPYIHIDASDAKRKMLEARAKQGASENTQATAGL